MANYYWKGAHTTESQTPANWVTTSGGSTEHSSLPDSDVTQYLMFLLL